MSGSVSADVPSPVSRVRKFYLVPVIVIVQPNVKASLELLGHKLLDPCPPLPSQQVVFPVPFVVDVVGTD